MRFAKRLLSRGFFVFFDAKKKTDSFFKKGLTNGRKVDIMLWQVNTNSHGDVLKW